MGCATITKIKERRITVTSTDPIFFPVAMWNYGLNFWVESGAACGCSGQREISRSVLRSRWPRRS